MDSERKAYADAWLQEVFRAYFLDWLAVNKVDWVIAANLTLPDAAPVTRGLYAAAHHHYIHREKGGIIFWDHDLFQSCGALADDGSRIYPLHPSPGLFLPRWNGVTQWFVVSEGLADEVASYSDAMRPRVIPNILPDIPKGPLDARHLEFARQLNLEPDRPLILNPVRLTRIKGSHLAIHLLAGMKEHAQEIKANIPYLLIFGLRDEDPAYAREVATLASQLGVEVDVRFLDGVPLESYKTAARGWRLDEVDLCRLAKATCGGVAFTPSVPNMESVGLGPGIASNSGIPCASTDYEVIGRIYPTQDGLLRFSPLPQEAFSAGRRFIELICRFHRSDSNLLRTFEEDRVAVRDRFSTDGWQRTLRGLEESLH